MQVRDFSDIQRLFDQRSARLEPDVAEDEHELTKTTGDVLRIPDAVWGFNNPKSEWHPGVFCQTVRHDVDISKGTDWSAIDDRYRAMYMRIDNTLSNGLSKTTGFRKRLEQLPISVMHHISVLGALDEADRKRLLKAVNLDWRTH